MELRAEVQAGHQHAMGYKATGQTRHPIPRVKEKDRT